ncbi:MAG: PQQ-like beta-propeller repeat protein [candidate division Zixibacteria bacterium]|nr:PQQ-like beta-propeller repeat protein [candidate division Zixibacteria bacterium]
MGFNLQPGRSFLRMKIIEKAFIIFIFLFLSCASHLKFPEMDFKKLNTDWRSFRYDRINQTIQNSNINLPLKLFWKKKIGPSCSTPLILEKLIIIGTLEQKLVFLDFNTGEKSGSYSLDFPLAITPCADESILYFNGGKENSNLFALSLKSGALVWKKRLRDISSSPMIIKGGLFVATERGEFLSLNKINGEEFWKYRAADFIYSAATFSGEALYFGAGDGKVYSLEIDSGKKIWSYETEGAIFASPSIEEKTLYLGSADGYFYALDISTGELLWKYKTRGSIHSSASLDKGRIYFGSNDGHLYALSSKSGELVWSFVTDGPIHSSPLIIGDKIFFGSLDGNFYGVNSSTGEMVFKYKTGGMIYASPSFSEGKILIPSMDGYLYCFE